MAIVTISLSLDMAIPENVEAVDNFCTALGYTGFLADGITAQSKAAFVKVQFIKFFKHHSGAYKSEAAAQIARLASLSSFETNLIIT